MNIKGRILDRAQLAANAHCLGISCCANGRFQCLGLGALRIGEDARELADHASDPGAVLRDGLLPGLLRGVGGQGLDRAADLDQPRADKLLDF